MAALCDEINYMRKDDSLDKTAMYKLGYGLYVLTARSGAAVNGCIVNTVIQVTGDPNRISVTVNKQNYTCGIIAEGGMFAVSVLSESVPFGVIHHFGFQRGREVDKLSGITTANTAVGLPYLPSHTNAYIEGKVYDSIDLGSHIMFFADVTDCKTLSDEPSVTYDYYQKNIKPRPEAPKKKGYICRICGYFHEGDLPDDFICPICKHSVSDFEPVGFDAASSINAAASTNNSINNNTTIKGEIAMKKYVCPICGYVHEGDTPPEFCPICKAPASKFVEQAAESTWADEHVVGVAQGVDAEIIEGLRMNFSGECSEVGMYLAMSRVAFREGYPEIGLYWEKAAFEEAEHAAKFAELLGEVVTPSTKKNLEMRVDAERGACDGKKQLATKAKQLGLDAIHDTVHEMAKDEARHGRAFEGLLKRYFG